MVRRRVIAGLVLAVVLAPGVTGALGWTDDDYPLSSYPMFARPRPAVATFVGAVVESAESERRLGPASISGTPEPLQAVALVNDALDDDPGPLCAAVLDRVGLADDERLLLVRDLVDPVGHYTGADDATTRLAEVDCARVTG